VFTSVRLRHPSPSRNRHIVIKCTQSLRSFNKTSTSKKGIRITVTRAPDPYYVGATTTGGVEINTTRTAEKLSTVRQHSLKKREDFVTYAAVAVNISTLEVAALVRKIKPTENTAANPARHSRRLLVPCTFERTVMPIVGRRQATTVENADVKRNIACSEYVTSVFCFFFSTFDFRFFLPSDDSAVTFSSSFRRFFLLFLYFEKL